MNKGIISTGKYLSQEHTREQGGKTFGFLPGKVTKVPKSLNSQ